MRADHPESDHRLLGRREAIVALGSIDLIHRAIDLEGGGENVTTNQELMDRVRALDGGNAWAVGRFDALTANAWAGCVPGGQCGSRPASWVARLSAVMMLTSMRGRRVN